MRSFLSPSMPYELASIPCTRTDEERDAREVRSAVQIDSIPPCSVRSNLGRGETDCLGPRLEWRVVEVGRARLAREEPVKDLLDDVFTDGPDVVHRLLVFLLELESRDGGG